MDNIIMYVYSKLSATKQTNEVFEYAKAHDFEVVELEKTILYTKKDYVEARATGRVTKNDNTVIYARFSSNNQNEISITGQLDACFAHCKQYNYTIKAIYVDMAQTARFDNRIAFQKLNGEILNENYNGGRMLVYANSRFSRNRADSVFYRDFYNRFGLDLDSVTELCPRGKDGVFITSVRELMDAQYSVSLSESVVRGMRQRANDCKYTGGKVPYGFSINSETRSYEICESEAENVRLVFKMYVEKLGYTEILRELDSRGVVCRSGSPFSKNALADMIGNEKYAGVYVYNKRAAKNDIGERNSHAYKDDSEIIRIPNGIPAIVDQHTFEQAQKRKEENKKGTRSRRVKNNYLLTGMVVCGECGKSMTTNVSVAGRNKTKYLTYRCNNRNHGQKCNCKAINCDYLEAFALDTILEQVTTEARQSELLAAFSNQQDKAIQEYGRKKANLRHDIATIEEKNLHLVEAIEAGVGIKTLTSKLEINEKEIARIRADLDALLAHPPKEVNPEEFERLVEQTKLAIKAKSYHELKRFVSLYIDKVIVRNDDISVVVSFANIVLLVGGAEGS